jgi:hypothetical protein
VIDFLHVLTRRSVQLLDVSAAGLLLAGPRGELHVVAASSEAARLLELVRPFRTGLAARPLSAAPPRPLAAAPPRGLTLSLTRASSSASENGLVR